jgi:hypothetical protein
MFLGEKHDIGLCKVRGHDHSRFHVLRGPIKYGLPERGEKLLAVVHLGLHDRPNVAAEDFGSNTWYLCPIRRQWRLHYAPELATLLCIKVCYVINEDILS